MSDNSENKGNLIQTLQLLLTVVTVISAVAFIAKLFKRGTEGEENDSNEAAAAKARQELFKTVPPTFSDFIYRDWADILDRALLREAGEDEAVVYDVFRGIKNVSDVAKLIEFFGHRREMFTSYYISLPQAITTNFSAGEKFKLNSILAGKGIKYRFQ